MSSWYRLLAKFCTPMAYTPTMPDVASAGLAIANINKAYHIPLGPLVLFFIDIRFTLTGDTNTIFVTVPEEPIDSYGRFSGSYYDANNSPQSGAAWGSISSASNLRIAFYKYDFSNFDKAGVKYIRGWGWYIRQ